MNAPLRTPIHPKLGPASCTHIYRNAFGEAIMIVNRYDLPGGGKTYRPYNVLAGTWKAPETRPIYNLDQIENASPETTVVIVEGEKCADALTRLGFLATTASGGSNGVRKTDLSPLKTRKVIIWPDNDEPGKKYENALKEALLSMGCKTLHSVQLGPEMNHNHPKRALLSSAKPGWDVADAIAEGWSKEDLKICIELATLPQNKVQAPQTNDGSIPETNIELWHTSTGAPYATLHIEGHREHWAVDSSHFRHFLSHNHYLAEGKVLSQSALEDQRRTMAGEALFSGHEHTIHTRLGAEGGDVYLDLGNRQWNAVQIAPAGWRVIQTPIARFQRARSVAPLPVPTPSGADINLLHPFVNVATETDFQMLVSWLLGCFQPSGPYPILILSGEQGSAKSTTTRILRSLIDPADPMTRSAPRSEQDLVIAAQHNHVLAFDNLSSIQPATADALCRLSTGGGFGTRKLHTNSEEVLFNATRPCLLNGIPDLASRPDLADRAIIISLPVIDGNDRAYESDIWSDFEQVAPRILGALLNAVSHAMSSLSRVELSTLPRMADFARWVSAAEPALGWQPGAFMSAYTANRSAADQAAIESNPVAEAVLSLVRKVGPWKGSATELSQTLRRHFPHLTDDTTIFPRQPNKLSGELKRVQPVLRRQGISLTKERTGKAGQRLLIIKETN